MEELLTLTTDTRAVEQSTVPRTSASEFTISVAVMMYRIKNRNIFSNVKLLRTSMDSFSHPITKNRMERDAAIPMEILKRFPVTIDQALPPPVTGDTFR